MATKNNPGSFDCYKNAQPDKATQQIMKALKILESGEGRMALLDYDMIEIGDKYTDVKE